MPSSVITLPNLDHDLNGFHLTQEPPCPIHTCRSSEYVSEHTTVLRCQQRSRPRCLGFPVPPAGLCAPADSLPGHLCQRCVSTSAHSLFSVCETVLLQCTPSSVHKALLSCAISSPTLSAALGDLLSHRGFKNRRKPTPFPPTRFSTKFHTSLPDTPVAPTKISDLAFAKLKSSFYFLNPAASRVRTLGGHL